MGFSVSASTALIFVAMFIGFGIFYSASSNGLERVSDAYTDETDRALERQNTAINVTSATYNASTDRLSITVENTGSASLSVEDTDVLVDNVYESDFAVREVDGDSGTDVWLPGERLHVEINATQAPSRVKIVTGLGVAATEDV